MYYPQRDINTISGGCGVCGGGGVRGGCGVCGGDGVRGGCGGGGGGGGGGDGGATAAVATTSDLTCFRLRILNFLDCIFHYTLEIIFRNFNNSFLTSYISLQATFGI